MTVTGTGRDPETFPNDEKSMGWRDIESTAGRVRAEGRRALPIIVDVTKKGEVRSMVEDTLRELGRIDILVNNAALAGGPDRVPIVELDPDVFRRSLAVKLQGTFLCTQAVTEVLIRQQAGGKIVNLSSMVGKTGLPRLLAYTAANFGVVGMTQSMARELGPYGINVNSVCPGVVDTSRNDIVGNGERWKEMAAQTALGRTGTPEEVGDFIAYLCTEAESWIHGQSINIDGGRVMEH